MGISHRARAADRESTVNGREPARRGPGAVVPRARAGTIASCCRTAGLDPRSLAAARSVLSDDERTRHDQFSRDDDRVAYAMAHALLRGLLAQLTGGEPAALRFDRDVYGKPFIVPDTTATAVFSLSHCPGVASCVAAPAGRVGIDVEPIATTIDAVAFARRFFTGAEAAWLESAAPCDRPSRLCTLWTLKEALAKALGYGLGLPLTSTSFTIDAGSVALTVFPPFDDDVWHCATVDLGSHVVSVVANEAAAAAPLHLVEVEEAEWPRGVCR